MVLGGLDEETSFTVYDIGCGADALLGYGWLASHNLQLLYQERKVSMCEKAGCPDPTRCVCLASAAPKASAAALMSPRELRELLSLVGMGQA